MPFNDAAKNAMLTAGLGAAVTHVALHTGDPGLTGANEQTATGSPAYARKTVAWAAAASGRRSNSAAVTFDVPATTLYAVGFWNSLAIGTGTFYGYALINPTLVAGVGVVAADDVLTSYGHGLANGDRVQVFNVLSESLPTGTTEGTFYFVVGSTADTFQLSLTSGGAAENVTAPGEVFWQKVTPDVYASQGTVVLSIGALVLDANVV